jgi:hypothetical protein
MINQWEASAHIGFPVCSKRVGCEGNEAVVMNCSIPQSSLERTHNSSTHCNFSAMFEYFYPPPQRRPIQPPPPALPIWSSSTDCKHKYAFIVENISILTEPSQPWEPVVEANSFSGKKRKAVRSSFTLVTQLNLLTRRKMMQKQMHDVTTQISHQRHIHSNQ